MNAFIGLVKKDMAIARFSYLVWLVFAFLIFLGGFGLNNLFNERLALVSITFLMFTGHAVFLPSMILIMLRIEGKTQLWLHSPQSSVKLLLAKVVSSLLFQLLSQLIVTMYCLIAINVFNANRETGFIAQIGIKEILLVNLVVVLVALYFSSWLIFYWTVYHSLAQYPLIKKFRWLVIAFIFFGYNVIETNIIKIPKVKEALMSKTLEVKSGFVMHYMSNGWNVEITTAKFPFVPLILYALLALILFISSSKLLDRKVEV